ncbi:B12-binding domain-containing radical SAM protein [bacterium]|nr:B12-binding domain-containing radical SAM protein [bacterium]
MNNCKIVLSICPSWGPELPPLGLGLLKSSLNYHQIASEIIDFNIECFQRLPKELRNSLWDKSNLEPWLDPISFQDKILPHLHQFILDFAKKLANHSAPYIGLSVLDSNVWVSNLLVEEIKKLCNKVIIAGGPETTFKEPRVKLSKSFDYYFVGEGEQGIVEWIRWLDSGKKLKIPDGVYNTVGELCIDRKFEQSNLQLSPIPDFSGLLLNQYEENALPIITSRSCLFKCRFCSDFKSMGQFRKLSQEHIEAILSHYYKLGYREVWFNDLLINGVIKELIAAFTNLETRSQKLSWIALATPNRQLKLDELIQLKNYGLKTLNLGLESGSDDVMKMMKKGFNQKFGSEALKRIHQAGINTQLNIIIGFPGESEEHFLQTLEFLDDHKRYISGFTSINSCIALPGSYLSDHKEKYGIRFPENQDPSLWFSKDNNPQIRENRLHRLKEWIHQNHYDIYSSNQ